MSKLWNIAIGALVAAGVALAGPSAWAKTSSTCGLSTTSTTNTIFYDPFSTSPVSSVGVNLPLTRFTAGGGAKTQQVDFYFTQPSGSPAYQILFGGVNVLYTQASPGSGGGAPTLTSTSPPSGTVGVNFLGASQPDTISEPFTLTIPAGVDLSNGNTVSFAIEYVCNGTGGMGDVTSPAELVGAIQMPVFVLDALQANFAGPALDFGDITGLSNTGPFPTTLAGSQIDVRSSGPYDVTVKSDNTTTPFAMTINGSHTGTSIKYSLNFLNQALIDNTHPFFPSGKSCVRAGVTSAVALPISATLEDGAVGKTVGSYKDTVEITFTPKNTTTNTPGACS